MAEGGTVVVEVEPRLDQKKAKAGFSSFAKGAAGLFAGVFAARFAIRFGTDLIKQAEEYNSLVAGVGNLVANQQKALGDEASLTTDQIVRQAKETQRLTGFSDELLLSGARQLLSFQNIQNAGEGVEAIYDRANRALADLIASGALTDFNSGAIQLGKALNDPIKGVTALGRAGIQFTDDQKEAIATLVESNDILGAQKIILDELETVYGGTAEAQRDATAVIANAWQDLKVKAGQVLLPIVERIATFLVDRAIPAFEDWWPTIKAAGQALGRFLARGWELVRPALESAWGILQTVGEWIGTTLVPLIRDELWPVAVEVWDAISEAVSEAWTVIEPIWGNIVGAFQGLQETVETYVFPTLNRWSEENAETISGLQEDFQRGWAVIKPIILDWGNTVEASFQKGEDGLSDFERGALFLYLRIAPALEQLGAIFAKTWEAIVIGAKLAGAVLLGIWEIWGEDLKAIWRTIWEAIVGVVGGFFDVLEGLLDVFVGVFTLDWERAWEGLQQILSGAWQILVGTIGRGLELIGILFRALPGKILEWLGDLGGLLVQAGKDLIGGLIEGIRSKAGDLLTTIRNSVTDKIPGWIKGPLGIDSPSKVTMEFGRNVSEGLAMGIAEGASDVQRATNRMIPTIAQTAASAAAATAMPRGEAKTEINIHNPVQRTTNSGIQKGLALGRLMGA